MKLGGFICHALLVPIFVLCWVPPTAASTLLIRSGHYAVQAAQVAIAVVCGQLSECGDALGLAGTAAAGAITVAIALQGASAAAIGGSCIWLTMTWLNWGHRFGYSPAWTRFIFRMDMASYYTRGELRGRKELMPTDHAVYCFHPHGIVTCGFSSNGVWSREFHERATPKPLPHDWEATTWPGTIFFIAASLREPSHLFKLLCDASGRLESASRTQMLKYMRLGRNVAIIPGGFEDATLYAYGTHRVAMRKRKGLVKYALQHGYRLVPIYTFGENVSFYTWTGGLKTRLKLNKLQVPAVLFWGLSWLPIFPRSDCHCLSYVGKPLELPTIAEPTNAQVDEWHAKYLAALAALFDESKADAGEPDSVLEIW